jgi:hypothetical protein
MDMQPEEEGIVDKALSLIPMPKAMRKKRRQAASSLASRKKQLATLQKALARIVKDVARLAKSIAAEEKAAKPARRTAKKRPTRKPAAKRK